jgi:protein-disulfide isomerase
MSEDTTRKNDTASPYLVPGAIVVAGAFIALAVFMSNSSVPGDVATETPDAEVPADSEDIVQALLPVTEADHIRGSRTADIILIEYSDFRCGFCGVFHTTMKSIMERFDGRVAWVYRHAPFQPGGREAAIASECVAELAGPEAFWEYSDRAMADQRILNPAWHAATAESLGIASGAFAECVASDRHDEKLAAYTNNLRELGGRGTPFTVLLTKDGNTVRFAGAQPLEDVASLIEQVLATLE